ncbi:hypothetical protein HO133_006107 [Letharia lupina]|uniref:FAD-binding domain-containing protein n=1 Tax=Letharia lupina TaxID=560253 RepID=A0A8H6F814_9LECA|nr:uncharacterized protein HO133_006107 [Letharia lupina]KAF6218148.1 hypothetical protein HO133_006107 [Letharia lupina]
MSKLRMLVSGAGIAGPTLAFWLARAGALVTIIERAPVLRAIGQNIDNCGAGIGVIQRMGLEDIICKNKTNEEGIAFVDAINRPKAQFEVYHSGKGKSFTSDTEISRETLAKILHDGTKEEADSTPQREFDLLVAGDGLGSPTRSLIFAHVGKICIRSLNQCTSYFSIPYQDPDGTLARWYNAPGRRCTLTRPNNAGKTIVFLSIISISEKLQSHSKLSQNEQKQSMHEIFPNAGWEASRMLAGMDTTDDFYMQSNAQVKLDSWSKGRMSVVGAAAFCPSPISGMGTTVAIVGAYILAGEISRCGTDYEKAFEAYESIMRPFVDTAQSLPPGAPAIANPETAWGNNLMNRLLDFVSWNGLESLLGRFGGPPADAIVLPGHEM